MKLKIGAVDNENNVPVELDGRVFLVPQDQWLEFEACTVTEKLLDRPGYAETRLKNLLRTCPFKPVKEIIT